MMTRNPTAGAFALAFLLGTVTATAGAPGRLGQDPKVEVETETEPRGPVQAEPAELERLLAAHRVAAAEEDAAKLTAALELMAPYANEELLELGKDALKYRASKLDKEAAEAEADELGLRKKKDREEILSKRIAAVQAAGARVVGNFEEDGGPLLYRLLRDRKVRSGEPELLAAVIDGLGRTRYGKAEREVITEFQRYGDKHVMRACVRYFGRLPTRDENVVRKLCESLDAPEPANVHSASNPPASYWEERWQVWSFIRRDVTWSLKEITGQVFKPAEGEHKSDKEKALRYVKENARELGLK